MGEWRNFGQPRPAETYRSNKPAKAKGRGTLKRMLAANMRLEADLSSRFAGESKRLAAIIIDDVDTAIDNRIDEHEAKLAARRERDRARRAAKKAGTGLLAQLTPEQRSAAMNATIDI